MSGHLNFPNVSQPRRIFWAETTTTTQQTVRNTAQSVQMVRSPRGFCFFRWRVQWDTINCCICCLYMIYVIFIIIYYYFYIFILWWWFCFLANGTALPKCNWYDEYVFNQQLGDPGNLVRCTNNCRFNMLNTKTSFKRAWGVPSLQGFWTCNDVVPALPEIKSVALCYGVKDLCLPIKFHWEMKTHTSLMRSQTVIQPLKNKNHLAHTGSWTWNPSFDFLLFGFDEGLWKHRTLTTMLQR